MESMRSRCGRVGSCPFLEVFFIKLQAQSAVHASDLFALTYLTALTALTPGGPTASLPTVPSSAGLHSPLGSYPAASWNLLRSSAAGLPNADEMRFAWMRVACERAAGFPSPTRIP